MFDVHVGETGPHDKWRVILMRGVCWCDQAIAHGCILLCWAMQTLFLEDFQSLGLCLPGGLYSGLWVHLYWGVSQANRSPFWPKLEVGFQFSWYNLLRPLKFCGAIQGQQEIEWIKPIRRYELLCTEKGLLPIPSPGREPGWSQVYSNTSPWWERLWISPQSEWETQPEFLFWFALKDLSGPQGLYIYMFLIDFSFVGNPSLSLSPS